MKLRLVKTLLWFVFGGGLMVIIMRIIHGPGSVVALTDIIPWGLWKGGGVVALVPIGGAGFTLAALVYIFHWERYKPLARGAVLLGLMCYSSVAAGLTFDIGIWWRIVYPVVFWQFHSTLFEIAWCIMLYLGVLVVEFSHTVIEKFKMPRLLSFLEKVSIIAVIAGISLSTLHQSSLGTLFLATPYRLHPLWYTDLLPVLFFITSIGLGCLTISWVTLVVHWLYDAKPPMKAISGLGRIAAVVLGFYLVLKFAEILVAGEGGLLFAAGWNTFNFWVEILTSALLPVALLASGRFRNDRKAMFWISAMAIVGMSLNRVNVAGLATLDATGATYFPVWMEWSVTLGILAFASLVYLFCVERFSVFESIDEETVATAYSGGTVDHADWKTIFFRNPLAEVRLYSVSFIVAVGLVFGLLPQDSVYGVEPEKTTVQGTKIVKVLKARKAGGSVRFFVDQEADIDESARQVNALFIDGNRNGDFVLFDHDVHVMSIEPKGSNCGTCHHMNKPYDEATACSECHSDMYLPVDIFDHDYHADKMGGNDGCSECHVDPSLPKVRENTKDCRECHRGMYPQDSEGEQISGSMATGYMDAMHGSCVGCHAERRWSDPEAIEGPASCSNCHRELPPLDDESSRSRL